MARQRVAHDPWLDLWGGTTGAFIGLDQFNRVIDQRWQNNTTSTPTDIDRYQYGYDRNSNRLYKANVVGTPIVTNGLDELYSYDNINRLTVMQRGTLNSGKNAITGTPSREMDYTLDPTGNWHTYLTKTSGTTDLNQTRTSNKVNEITNLTESTGPTWVVPAYDAAGNMTTMPQPASPISSFTAVYDAWNRMVSLSSGGSTVATYQYDGQNRRIVKYTAAISETRHFYWTYNWQDIEERVGSSTTADKQYVWAAPNMVDAGIQYVDALICRDDPTYGRLYAMQDANFNLTSICNTSGSVQERYYYDPYGMQFIMNGSWSSISSSAYAWVIGHQGLMVDGESDAIYNRNRYVHPFLGLFINRDPVGYNGGLNLYQYLMSNPPNAIDPSGQIATILGGALAGCVVAAAWSAFSCWWSGENKCQVTCKAAGGCVVGAIAAALAEAFPGLAGCLAGAASATINEVVSNGCDKYCSQSATDPLGCIVLGAALTVALGCLTSKLGEAEAFLEKRILEFISNMVGYDLRGACDFAARLFKGV